MAALAQAARPRSGSRGAAAAGTLPRAIAHGCSEEGARRVPEAARNEREACSGPGRRLAALGQVRQRWRAAQGSGHLVRSGDDELHGLPPEIPGRAAEGETKVARKQWARLAFFKRPP